MDDGSAVGFGFILGSFGRMMIGEGQKERERERDRNNSQPASEGIV